MASSDILCFNAFILKNKIVKIEHKKIFRGPSKIFKNISWPINICLKYFMDPTKSLHPPSYILNVWSLNVSNASEKSIKIAPTSLPGSKAPYHNFHIFRKEF